MGRLVEDMLVLAKLDEQRPLELRPVDLVASRATPPPMPRPSHPSADHGRRRVDPAIVNGDEDRLRQVIGNVVDQRDRAHRADGVPIEIRIAASTATSCSRSATRALACRPRSPPA